MDNGENVFYALEVAARQLGPSVFVGGVQNRFGDVARVYSRKVQHVARRRGVLSHLCFLTV